MKNIFIPLIGGALMFAQVATASIIGQIGTTTISSPTLEDFETLPVGYSNGDTIWIGSDITLTDNGVSSDFVVTSGRAGMTSNSLYQNGGSLGHIGLFLNSGANIDAIEFQISHGWNAGNPLYVWVRAMNDGVFTGFGFDFDFAAPAPILSFISDGTVFDELQIFATTRLDDRNSHSLTMLSAAAIDNIRVGGSESQMPVPTSIALIGLGLLGVGWSQRRKA